MMGSKLEGMLELELVTGDGKVSSKYESDILRAGVLLMKEGKPIWIRSRTSENFGIPREAEESMAAQCLGAAQKTVPDGFSVHSMTCYFLLAGDNQIPLEYSVQRVRDGKSFVTRTVVANQNGNSICTSTLSFSRPGSAGEEPLRHASTAPSGILPPPDINVDAMCISLRAPQTSPVGIEGKGGSPEQKRIRSWIRAPAKILNAGSQNEVHQMILGFLSDWIFLPGVPLAHGLWKFPDAILSNTTSSPLDGSDIGMMATLSHTIIIHEPLLIRADEWMLFEIETPWSGEGRGV
ncbi:unnamed protein product [Clonostachys rosea f. rosea IK726]|uniref:Dehydrogenase (DH) domain-containing protein n=2 Tax=Bionectria ochroleuca TaxID=29856 RepID=A0A0B7KB02_BIOOC|nr:unnamed protein product [Clonostachys rosea f. rosea IK726]